MVKKGKYILVVNLFNRDIFLNIKQEDKQLINLVRKFGTKWTKVSNLMNGRTNKQCIRRWRKIIELKNESFVESSVCYILNF